MNRSTAFFTIVIPHFNTGADELKRAVESAVMQADCDFPVQIVTVDDGSDDASSRNAAGLLETYQSRPGIKLERLRHTVNRGLAAARNTGISAAEGRYIVFLDSDDWLFPDVLRQLAEELKSYSPEVALTQTRLVSSPQPGDDHRPCPADKAMARAVPDAPQFVSPATMPELSLTLSSWAQAYSREFLRRTGIRFDTALRRWEDRPFLVSAQLQAKGVLLVPLLARAYFVPEGRTKSESITRGELHRADALHMMRHIRAVRHQLKSHRTGTISNYEIQHFWQSVARFYSVVGGAAFLRLTSDKKLGRLVSASAQALWVWRNELGDVLPPPLGATPFSRLPGLVRNYLVWSLGRASNSAGMVNLALLFGLGTIARRTRQRLR